MPLRAVACCCLIVGTLTCWPMVSVGAEERWTVSRIIQSIEAREIGIEDLEVTMEILELVPHSRKKFYEAHYRSAKLMAEAAGMPVPPSQSYESHDSRSPDPYRIRYYRGSKGLQRFDRLLATQGSDYQKRGSCIYDGTHWWSMVDNGNYATLDNGENVPRDGRYLGFDFEWRVYGSNVVLPHSLAAALRELDVQGFVQMSPSGNSDDSGLVSLLIRYPARAMVVEHTLFFDPRLGMALVRYATRPVYKQGEDYIHMENVGSFEGTWENMKEISPGIWVPTLFRASYSRGVLFPKTGTKYPPGFDFEKSQLTDYRVEVFILTQTEARVIDLRYGHKLEAETFKPDLPKDVIVYDDINNKVYQTRDLIPLTLEEDMRQAFAASRKSGYGVWIWLIVANLLLIAAFGGWLWLRRRRSKITKLNSDIAS